MPCATAEEQRVYQRKWIRQRREKFFTDKSCVDCGSTENLQLDHVNPKTKISHRIWSWKESRRLAEIAKCVVRCQDCHLVKSLAEGSVQQPGEANGRVKLTNKEISSIRRSSRKASELAVKYNVHQRTIQKIRSGERWKTLPL